MLPCALVLPLARAEEGALEDPKSSEKVKRPYDDGLPPHRAIAGFMVQGGCPRGDGRGGPGCGFEDVIDAKALGLDPIEAIVDRRLHPWLGMRAPESRDKVVLPLDRRQGISSQAELDERKAEVEASLAALTLRGA